MSRHSHMLFLTLTFAFAFSKVVCVFFFFLNYWQGSIFMDDWTHQSSSVLTPKRAVYARTPVSAWRVMEQQLSCSTKSESSQRMKTAHTQQAVSQHRADTELTERGKYVCCAKRVWTEFEGVSCLLCFSWASCFGLLVQLAVELWHHLGSEGESLRANAKTRDKGWTPRWDGVAAFQSRGGQCGGETLYTI